VIRDPVSYFAQHNVDKKELPQVTTNKFKKNKPKSKDSKATIPDTEDAVKSDLPADAAVDVPAAAAPAPATPAAEGSLDVSGGPKAGPAKGVDALRKEVFSGKNRKPAATPADVAPALDPPSSDPAAAVPDAQPPAAAKTDPAQDNKTRRMALLQQHAHSMPRPAQTPEPAPALESPSSVPAAAVPDAQPPAAAKTEPAKGEPSRRMDKLREGARSQARVKQTAEPVADAVDPIAPAEERGPDVPPKPKSAAMARLQHHVKHGGAAVQPAATPTAHPPAAHTQHPPAVEPPAAHTQHPPAVEPPAAHTRPRFKESMYEVDLDSKRVCTRITSHSSRG